MGKDVAQEMTLQVEVQPCGVRISRNRSPEVSTPYFDCCGASFNRLA